MSAAGGRRIDFAPLAFVLEGEAIALEWEFVSSVHSEGGVKGCVKKTRRRHAVREMRVGPSESPCRGRLQTAMGCFGQKPRW